MSFPWRLTQEVVSQSLLMLWDVLRQSLCWRQFLLLQGHLMQGVQLHQGLLGLLLQQGLCWNGLPQQQGLCQMDLFLHLGLCWKRLTQQQGHSPSQMRLLQHQGLC